GGDRTGGSQLDHIVLFCRMKFFKGVLGCLALAGTIAFSDDRLQAQNKRPFTLVGLAELSRLIGPQLSPDGTALAYFVSVTDWKVNRSVFHLWRQSITGG